MLDSYDLARLMTVLGENFQHMLGEFTLFSNVVHWMVNGARTLVMRW